MKRKLISKEKKMTETANEINRIKQSSVTILKQLDDLNEAVNTNNEALDMYISYMKFKNVTYENIKY